LRENNGKYKLSFKSSLLVSETKQKKERESFLNSFGSDLYKYILTKRQHSSSQHAATNFQGNTCLIRMTTEKERRHHTL
jgi:hypothetical protein